MMNHITIHVHTVIWDASWYFSANMLHPEKLHQPFCKFRKPETSGDPWKFFIWYNLICIISYQFTSTLTLSAAIDFKLLNIEAGNGYGFIHYVWCFMKCDKSYLTFWMIRQSYHNIDYDNMRYHITMHSSNILIWKWLLGSSTVT